MTRGLLLDEHISPTVAFQIRATDPSINILSIAEWRAGSLTARSDADLLQAALEDGMVLVTYDLRTIPPLVSGWAATGRMHGGLVFVDQQTIRPADVGGLVRAVIQLWHAESALDWRDRIRFLTSA